jgi:hypothetical protein
MIIKNQKQNIYEFNKYLKDKLNNIDKLSSDDSKLFKKILYVSFIDSLSACIYPDRRNKERFISTIERFSDWEHKNNYCLLHIAKFTSASSDPCLEKIRLFSQQEIDNWLTKTNGMGIITFNHVPLASEIKSNWCEPTKDSGLTYKLCDFKHSHLLYKLRNSLVHQFQSKGTELGVYLPEVPFYQVVNGLDENGKQFPKSIELVYPTTFIKKLCHEILKKVNEYLINGNINPFPHYYSGDYWLEGLNN